MQTSAEQQEEQKIVGLTLRVGSFGSIALIVMGALLLVSHVEMGAWVLQAGFLLLMFTPALRILVAGIVFLHEGDRRYALVALIVLSIVVATSALSLLNILPRLER